MRRIGTIVVLLIGVVSLLGPARAQTQPLPGDFMGMVVRDPHYEWNTNPRYPGVNRAFYDTLGVQLETLGVKYVRIEMRAEDGGEQDPANPIRFANYDYFIDTVAPRHELKVIALLATNLVRTPFYVDPEQIERTDQEVKDCASSTYGCGTNEYMRIWLDRAFAIADRYADRVAAYEVMNEENRYLNGGGKGISPRQMARLLTTFYRVFKVQGGPTGSFGAWRNQVKILLGGLHPSRCDDCRKPDGTLGMTDREYLNALYTVDGLFATFKRDNPAYGYPLDGVGYHPFPLEISRALLPGEVRTLEFLPLVPARMEAIREVMLVNGDAGNKLWVTEVGERGAPRSVDPPGDNEALQATFMRTIYSMLWTYRDFVETVLWFKYEDFAVPNPEANPGVPWYGPENWGVVRIEPRCISAFCDYDLNGVVRDYKQSYTAYQSMATSGIPPMVTPRGYLPLVQR